MGCFSWTKADLFHTEVANLMDGDSFKLLIPAEFGGGYLSDSCYDNYGHISDEKSGRQYDAYELLAYFNQDFIMYDGTAAKEKLKGIIDGELPFVNGEKTEDNRFIGIDIGCYDKDMIKLKYPLKIVSASYEGTYEECNGISFSDPEQGWSETSWDEYCESKTYTDYMLPYLHRTEKLELHETEEQHKHNAVQQAYDLVVRILNEELSTSYLEDVVGFLGEALAD